MCESPLAALIRGARTQRGRESASQGFLELSLEVRRNGDQTDSQLGAR